MAVEAPIDHLAETGALETATRAPQRRLRDRTERAKVAVLREAEWEAGRGLQEGGLRRSPDVQADWPAGCMELQAAKGARDGRVSDHRERCPG